MAAPEPAQPVQEQGLVSLLRAAGNGHDGALQALSRQLPDMRIERLARGALIVMPPTGGSTGNRNFELALELGLWIRATKTGLGFDSSTGFRLRSSAIRSADLAWVRTDRWEALSPEERKTFPPLCPDFVAELLSSPQDLASDLDKLQEFIDAGAQLGWLLDPFLRRVHVFRPEAPVEVLNEPTMIAGDPVLVGFQLDLTAILGFATQAPFERALRAKVAELFGSSARVVAGVTTEDEPLLEIRTVLDVDEADSKLRQLEHWMVEQYPQDQTVVGLLHVHYL